ncbi:MAG: cytochrome c family protein [Parvularcula sp.]|jgi:cytochrome c|nr:cytochrome c family protein [Parvularcula sp.]
MTPRLASLLVLAVILMGCGNGAADGEAPEMTSDARMAAQADVVLGQRLFRVCATCHERMEGAPHRVGPNLWGIVGAESGRHADFRYSRALASANIVWDEAALDAYLEDPQGFLPGNRMGYQGMEDPADRRDLIAYLKTLSD